MARQVFTVTKLAENTKLNVTTLVKTAGWSTTLGVICVKWVIVDRRPRNFAKDTWATGKKSGRDRRGWGNILRGSMGRDWT